MTGPPEAPDVSPPPARGSEDGPDHDSRAQVRFFLIADVRGYTSFTQSRGDEAAGALAARFAAVTRATVAAHRGRLLELRGDEALVVFTSGRPAVRAAMALRDGFIQATLADPDFPLPVGIGLDAGEAVAVEGGYRGGALNLAARLCGRAGPGQVLASQEVTHLARRVEGVDYQKRGRVRVKGLAEPVPVVELVPTPRDDAREAAFRSALATPRPRRRRVHALLASGVVLAVLAASGLFVATTRGNPSRVLSAEDRADVVDVNAGRVVDQVLLRSQPSGVAAGAGALWTTNPGDESVSRLDPESRELVTTIPVGGNPSGLVVAGGLVWVSLQSGRSVAQINPDVDRVVARVTVGNQPTGIAAGPSGVWVANTADGTISRIKTRTGVVSEPVDVGGAPTGVAVTQDAVWVTNAADGTVSEVDPRSGNERARVPVGNGPAGITAGAGAIWVALNLDGAVARIDPATGSVIAKISVGNGPSGVVAAAGSVWVSNEDGATLVRVDPETNAVDVTLPVGGAPHGLAFTDGELWATAAATASSHRGGTLTVLGGEPSSIDPAIDYGGAVPRITGDGLVGLRRASGAAGTTLVPDLATSIPTPVDGGRTYAFRLRRGVRYSTGKFVLASDLRRAIERQFRLPAAPGRDYFGDILGADVCQRSRAAAGEGESECDLSRGIETDDATGAVTFHLVEPDPEFLYKLSLSLSNAVPAGTPDHVVAAKPVPGTGPYMISRFLPGREIELVRNPYFREWSHAAQPDGYADRIVVRRRQGDTSVDQVLGGTADLIYGPFPGRLPELETRYAGQLHVSIAPWLQHITLDSTRAPFDDVRARQALSYAVDRDRVARLWARSVETRMRPTCQILPPAFPGYAPYCRYPHDLAEARRLVHRSGTTGARVTLMAHTPPLGRYLSGVLRSLGYQVRLRAAQPAQDAFFLAYGPAFDDVQVRPGGWGPDYPAASALLEPLLSCRAAQAGDQRGNLGRFCDRDVDAAMRRALALQQSQPASAGRLWQQVEKLAADRAALLPLGLFEDVAVTSRRTGNYTYQPIYGVLLSELWVK